MGIYRLDAMQVARGHGHAMEFVGTAKFRGYSVDKYLCACGDAEVQVGSSLQVGCWLSTGAHRPCEHKE